MYILIITIISQIVYFRITRVLPELIPMLYLQKNLNCYQVIIFACKQYIQQKGSFYLARTQLDSYAPKKLTILGFIIALLAQKLVFFFQFNTFLSHQVWTKNFSFSFLSFVYQYLVYIDMIYDWNFRVTKNCCYLFIVLRHSVFNQTDHCVNDILH